MKQCSQCQQPFEPKKSWQRFCSEVCHDAYWVEMRQLATQMNALRRKKEKA